MAESAHAHASIRASMSVDFPSISVGSAPGNTSARLPISASSASSSDETVASEEAPVVVAVSTGAAASMQRVRIRAVA
eukprot:941442-Pleurochrysis_carterae.AAC.1